MAANRRDHETILRVARMRYDDRLPQTEIARELGVSAATVSRILKVAMDLGYVEIGISPAGRRQLDLERALRRAHGLELAIVVQGDARGPGGYHTLARATAAALADRLVAGTILGVSDGETVAAVADALRRARSADIDVISLIGGIGDPHIATHSAEICRVLATNVGGRIWQLPAPAVVETAAVARSLAKIPAVSAVIELMRRMTVGLVGIGSMTQRASIFRHSLMGSEHVEAIRRQGAVGSICGRFFDAEGRPLPTAFDDRTLAIDIATLKEARLRVAVAAGTPKLDAVAAALRGRMVNALCTDAPTAQALLAGSRSP